MRKLEKNKIVGSKIADRANEMLLTPVMTLLALQCPKTPFYKMCDIIHTPELWATGAGIMFGVPPFKVENVTGPFSSHSESMVAFHVGTHKVSLSGKAPDQATLTIFHSDGEKHHTQVRCNANAMGNAGSNLVLDVKTEHEIEPVWCRMALMAGIESLPDISVTHQHPALRQYRENVRKFPLSRM